MTANDEIITFKNITILEDTKKNAKQVDVILQWSEKVCVLLENENGT